MDNNRYNKEGRFSHERYDCTVIALSHAFDLPYSEAHLICKQAGRQDKKGFTLTRVLTREPLKMIMNRVVEFKATPHMTLKKFAERYKDGIYIIDDNRHSQALVNGQPLNFNSMTKRIQRYWKIGQPGKPDTSLSFIPSVQQEKVKKEISTDLKVGDLVQFMPHRLSGTTEKINGIISEIFLNKENKEYCKIEGNSKTYLKRLNSIHKVTSNNNN